MPRQSKPRVVWVVEVRLAEDREWMFLPDVGETRQGARKIRDVHRSCHWPREPYRYRVAKYVRSE